MHDLKADTFGQRVRVHKLRVVALRADRGGAQSRAGCLVRQHVGAAARTGGPRVEIRTTPGGDRWRSNAIATLQDAEAKRDAVEKLNTVEGPMFKAKADPRITRVGRFMVQDLGKHIWAPFGRVSWYPASVAASAIVVLSWGYFLYQGVTDPLGGINTLWPLFGISNQLLAAIALCVGTTVVIKMGKKKFAFITLLPLTWLTIVNLTAGYQKIFAADPKLGFLTHASVIANQIATNTLPANIKSVEAAQRMIFNDRLDAALSLFFMLVVVVVLAASAREWVLVALRRKPANVQEAPFVDTALASMAKKRVS